MSEDSARSRSAKDVLDAVFALADDPADSVTAMNREDVQAYLAEEGVDLREGKKRLVARLAQFKGQARLDQARAERLEFQKTAAEWQTRIKGSVSDAKAALIQRLGTVGTAHQGQALAYFRKLDAASNEDVMAMLDDLDQLESLDGG